VNFPADVRALVTSRPLDDIHKYDASDVHHVHVSMDDTVHISKESSERNIQLSTLRRDVGDLKDRDFSRLGVNLRP